MEWCIFCLDGSKSGSRFPPPSLKQKPVVESETENEPAQQVPSANPPVLNIVIPETTEGDVPPDAIPQNSEPAEMYKLSLKFLEF